MGELEAEIATLFEHLRPLEQELAVLQSVGADFPRMSLLTGRQEQALRRSWEHLGAKVHEADSSEIRQLLDEPGSPSPELAARFLDALTALNVDGDSLAAWLVTGLRQSQRLKDRSQDLRRLIALFGLSGEEAATLFEIDEVVLGKWLEGTPLPMVQGVRLDRALAAAERLCAMFKPEALPDVVRREAPVFQGRRALDLILDCRADAVAAAYDRLLSYSA